MNFNGVLQRHWLRVSFHFGMDAFLFATAFFLGMNLRFGSEWAGKLSDYYPSILLGTAILPCTAYIFGLYSGQRASHNLFRRALVLALCLGITIALMLPLFYLKFSSRIGRGVMVISALASYVVILLHHVIILHRLKNYRERVTVLITCELDELEVRLNASLWHEHLQLAGVVHTDGYLPTARVKSLGHARDLAAIVQREQINRVLCINQSINDPVLRKSFCQLRYSGITVMPLINLCEEAHQNVPLELITTEWLLSASGQPQMLYIKKIKRGFDIVSSLIGLLVLGPVMLLGMVAVKLTSKGPVFYRQIRSGRFNKPFEMLKLRTMRVDAEKDGAVWAQLKNDPRTTPVGGFLRKYRIDEIPQLINVLGGEMSLVGPRPERPQFVEELAAQVPFFHERLMIQPGITGWAQVCYPYGANVEDAQRKLEYDLYYMKHMSLFLDLFILLDTVRIILRGGLGEEHKQSLPRYETSRNLPANLAPNELPVPSAPPR